ncbi:YqhG family protein [Paenibacillus sp. ACRRX]|uniref:YqhG family protein n=1 Tax=unclassified Paenibacillus TaxID=185978 RepID=UPI001EF69D35|nr:MULTISPECIES: YqhG family protein [unclassified Paenibacillus]MCG7406114.1 YqhG family protein [Paenibacillus sp. ACRRX]MDK8182569.1 YqhG family protein [Paenibacillus sp. UMB4589-SE434]
MDTEQITRFVMRYLESTECHILEKTPAYVTVKLSEQADRVLTNRPYYWGFVDRTGAEAETMRFTFVFDPTQMPPETNRGPISYVTSPVTEPTPLPPAANNNGLQDVGLWEASLPLTGEQAQIDTDVNAANVSARPVGHPGSSQTPNQTSTSQAVGEGTGDTIMQRYFGVAPAFTGGGGGIGRIPKDNVNFGSQRLEQIMQAALQGGRYLSLFEESSEAYTGRGQRRSAAYEPYLLLNVKLEFACDLKREELHSFGVSLVSGTIHPHFMELVKDRHLTPKLPANVHTMTWRFTLEQAAHLVEQRIRHLAADYDMSWAVEASERLDEEWERLAAYYEPLIKQEEEAMEPGAVKDANESPQQPLAVELPPRATLDSMLQHLDLENVQQSHAEPTQEPSPQARSAREQFEIRCNEIRWQFEPRITLSVINAALLHLPSGLNG